MVILAVDVETKGLNAQEFLLGCVVDQKGKERYFYSPTEMWEWIITYGEKMKRYGKKVYVYAHNHEYDFYSYGQENLMNEKMKYISFRPFIAMYSDNIYFLDTMAFYSMSLEEVGKIVGLHKLETPKELIEGGDREYNIEELKPYCLRDTMIVLRAIENIRNTMSKMGYRPRSLFSAGQIAISSFLTYITRNNQIWKIADLIDIGKSKKQMRVKPSEYDDKVREGYRGGRCQSFQKGEFKNTSMIDLNALYPFIMINMKFPDLKSETFFKKPLEIMKQSDILNKIGVLRCTIDSPKDIEIPYLPIRYKKKTEYPRGKTLTATWTILEVSEAVARGYTIKDIDWVVLYNELDINPFEEYLTELYKLRSKSKGEMKHVVKLIMNSLYGKFAQKRNSVDYKLIKRIEFGEYLNKGYKLAGVTPRGDIMSKDNEPYIARYTNPIISTLITAAARDHLYKFLEKINKEDLIYVDTDSIMLKNFDKYESLFKIGNRLGQWKIEYRDKKAHVLREKEYWIGDRIKMSGLSKREQDKKLIEKEGKVKIKRIISLKKAIRSGGISQVGKFDELTFDLGRKEVYELPDHIIDKKMD